MTEQEWEACNDPRALQLFIPQFKLSDRKARLLACACARHLWEHINDSRIREAVELAERYADHHASLGELGRAKQNVFDAAGALDRQFWDAAACAYGAVSEEVDGVTLRQTVHSAAMGIGHATGLDYLEEAEAGAWKLAVRAVEKVLLALSRDIVGNPFRPVTLDRARLTTTLTSLAQAIYDERAFNRLPILADALEDAGCTNADILNHCRQPGEHVRGCWVVDLLLGKK